MIYEEAWHQETMIWANPHSTDPDEREAFLNSVGGQETQLHKQTSLYTCVWKYAKPKDALHFIDPFFDPGTQGRKSINFFAKAIEEGRKFAPPQVRITPLQLAAFPKIAWHDPRSQILRAFKERGIKREEDFPEGFNPGSLIVSHEGRHRLWYASHLGETQVPIQLWIPLRDEKAQDKVRELQALIRELEEQISYLENREEADEHDEEDED